MSTQTKQTILALLVADTTMVSLLATDPYATSTRPAIFNSNITDLLTRTDAQGKSVPLPYDCVTFRITTASPTSGFEQGTPDAPGVPKTGPSVHEERWDVEVWTQKPSTLGIEAIAERLKLVLHERAFPLLNGAGRVFSTRQITAQPDLYDKDLKARYGLYSFMVRYELAQP